MSLKTSNLLNCNMSFWLLFPTISQGDWRLISSDPGLHPERADPPTCGPPRWPRGSTRSRCWWPPPGSQMVSLWVFWGQNGWMLGKLMLQLWFKFDFLLRTEMHENELRVQKLFWWMFQVNSMVDIMDNWRETVCRTVNWKTSPKKGWFWARKYKQWM